MGLPLLYSDFGGPRWNMGSTCGHFYSALVGPRWNMGSTCGHSCNNFPRSLPFFFLKEVCLDVFSFLCSCYLDLIFGEIGADFPSMV